MLRTTLGVFFAGVVIGINPVVGGPLLEACTGIEKLTPTPEAELRLFSCLKELASEVEARPKLPSNAVIISEEPCPPGWTNLNIEEPGTFARRAIVGVDPLDNEDTSFGKKELGGAEVVVLTLEQIPAHKHATTPAVTPIAPLYAPFGTHPVTPVEMGGPSFNLYASTTAGEGRYPLSESAGGTQGGETAPHNNMPPYVAFYFCRPPKS